MKLACRKDGYPSWKGVQARSGGSAQKICGYPLYHFPIQIWILNHPNHPIESSHYDHILIILHTVKALPKPYQSPLDLIRVENLSKKNESALWPGVLSWTDTNAREAVKIISIIVKTSESQSGKWEDKIHRDELKWSKLCGMGVDSIGDSLFENSWLSWQIVIHLNQIFSNSDAAMLST